LTGPGCHEEQPPALQSTESTVFLALDHPDGRVARS
jgi:hypothetical protein